MWLAMLLTLCELMVQTTIAPMEQPVASNGTGYIEVSGTNHHGTANGKQCFHV
jgi:hypothetical protein